MRGTSARGFTTIEALVSFVILLMMLAAVLGVYSESRQIFARGERKADLQQNARFAISQIARQVRMAGYFPENLTIPAANPTLKDPIRIATDSALVIYGDIDGTGTSGVVMFCLDGDLLRRTSGLLTSAPVYTCSSGQVLAQGVTDLRFAYYNEAQTPIPNPPAVPFQLDGQSPGSAPDMTTTTQRKEVHRVLITLTTRGYAVGMGPQNFTLTSDVEIRNVE